MSAANVGVIARVLNDHHAVAFATCNCGWTTDVQLGRSWRERHEFHQAEMVDVEQEASVCTIDGCTSPTKSQGWCQAHYNHNHRHGHPTEKRQS